MGSVALYRALEQFFEKGTGYILVIPVFLIPSILFWSSGLLQETLVIFFLGILVFTSLKLAGMKNILANLLLSSPIPAIPISGQTIYRPVFPHLLVCHGNFLFQRIYQDHIRTSCLTFDHVVFLCAPYFHLWYDVLHHQQEKRFCSVGPENESR